MAEGEVEATLRVAGCESAHERRGGGRDGASGKGKGMMMLPLPGSRARGRSQRLVCLRSSTKALSFARTTSVR